MKRARHIGQILFVGIISLTAFSLGAKDAEASALHKAPNNLGLVGYWSFEDGTGLKATDFSGNGNMGTLTNGPAWTSAGKIGKALLFDGTDDYVTIPDNNSLDLTNTISVAFWIKGTESANKVILEKGINTNYFFQTTNEAMDNGGKYISFSITPNNPQGRVSTSVEVMDGQWHHIVGTFDSAVDTLKIYVDGVLSKTNTSATDEPTNNSDPLVIGGRPSSVCYQGPIDDVRIYNRVLSATEVTALYNSGGAKINASINTRGPQSGLIGQWSFDGQDISGTTAYDRSGQGNNGTLTNNPSVAVGQFGQALSFTGSNYLSVTSLADAVFAGSWSQSLWIKTTVNSNLVITEKNDNNAFIQSVAGGEIRAGTAGTGGNYYDTTGAGINNNSWHLVTVTFNSSNKNLIIYIDGSANVSATTTDNAISHVNPFVVGARNTGLFGFPGSIDDVRIYNRALTAAEVAQMYSIGTTKVNAPQNTRGPQTGLVGLWSFDGKDLSGVTAYDRSGQGNNGTLTNGPSVAIGKIGQALSFDGINDNINLSNAIIPTTGSWSVSLWVKANNTSAAKYLFSQYGNALFMTMDTGGVFDIWAAYSGSSANFGGSVSYQANQWYNIVLEYDESAGAMHFYMDGTLRASDTSVAGTLTSQTPFAIGSLGGSTGFFNGSIDDVRVYNRALSAGEVLQLYNLGK